MRTILTATIDSLGSQPALLPSVHSIMSLQMLETWACAVHDLWMEHQRQETRPAWRPTPYTIVVLARMGTIGDRGRPTASRLAAPSKTSHLQ